ncbi:MAG TPA: hypothetical protein PK743_08880 [Luteimonas sp.]|nr:hypothetical protein [Luteimonas sp.]HRO26123.1 hypothetical protein [Luteimonas sp.]HRP72731.1 hypothetical protein [Luteimonas sp.]
MTTVASRAAILTLLAAVMAATRLHHFGLVPDASWAVFFIGGFYLHRWTRWAFPLLMALAVLVDWIVIRGQGLDFWSHYCVSPGYWALVPAYLSLWAGGWWLQRATQGRLQWRTLGLLAASVAVSVAVCHLFAQGGFYWASSVVAEPTFAGWWKNYSDWLPIYLRVTAMYVAIAAIAHVAATRLLSRHDVPAGERAGR